jgi:hypothetical protein
MNRITIQRGHEMLSVMRLTSRVLARTGQPVVVVEHATDGEARDSPPIRLDWEETVSIKQQLLENWDKLSGEEIIEKLDYIWTTQETGVPKVDLRQNPVLWLLRALAQEKCVYTDISEIEKTYQHCRHLGKWNSVLVRNNLAVLKARRRECLDSLNLLAEAIQLAVQFKLLIKAPFYNAALIFHQLYMNGLIFEDKYFAILDKIAEAVEPSENRRASDTPPESSEQAIIPSRGSDEVITKYKTVAEYAYKLEEPEAVNIFQKNIAYLAPGFDLFESFGDSADNIDTRTAHEFFEKGNGYAAEGMFADGLDSFKVAVQLDPSRAPEAAVRSEQLYDQWRYRENQRMSGMLDSSDADKFDKASSIILDLPDERLRRPDDGGIISTIKNLKYNAALRDAEEAARLEDHASARLIYIGLLKENGIEDSLRLYASSKLAEPLKKVEDDAERHQELNELILYGLHPEIVNRLADEFERSLVEKALTHTQDKQFDQAIRKYFWALLLPGRGQRREGLMRSALFLLGQFPEADRDIDACQAINDPAFAELKAELKERWDGKENAAVVAKFEKLDGEQWLSRKQVDELLQLLDKLIGYEPTTGRLLAKLRLSREKEAQQRFAAILTQMEKVAEEGYNSERREAITGELRTLRALAVHFAASKHRDYAKQIDDLVSETEEYLRHADNQKFMHDDMTFDINNRREEKFKQFREGLRDSTNPVQTLTTVCNTLRAARGDNLFDEAAGLSVHWLQRVGKSAYQMLAVEQPIQAATIIRNSLNLIEENQSVLPEEFTNEFKPFLEALAQEFESATTGTSPEPESPPQPSPPPLKKGFVRRFGSWLKSLFG